MRLILALLFFLSFKLIIQGQENGSIFRETTSLAGITFNGGTFGHAWGDINGDGFDDLFVTGHGKPYLYINNRNGTFQEQKIDYFRIYDTIEGIIVPIRKFDLHGASFGDINSDGMPDLYVAIGGDNGNSEGKKNVLFINNFGKLEVVNESNKYLIQDSIGRGRTPLWFDQNKDGFMDIFLSNLSRDDGKFNSPLYLYNPSLDIFDKKSGELGLENYALYFSSLLRSIDNEKNLLLTVSEMGDELDIYDCNNIPFGNLYSRKIIGIRDAAIGDFNGDCLQDVFITCNSWGSEIVKYNDTTLRIFLKVNEGNTAAEENRVAFQTNGEINIESSFFPYKGEIQKYWFIGKNGYQPNDSIFNLDPNLPINQGIKERCSYCIGNYIGYNVADQKWEIYIADALEKAGSAITITSKNSFDNLETFNFYNEARKNRDYLLLANEKGFYKLNDNFLNSGDNLTSAVSVVAADFDNDMDLDLMLSCAGAAINYPNKYYQNRGNGVFDEILNFGATGSIQGRSGALTTDDYNNDGFVDVFLENGEGKVSDDGVPFHFNNGPSQLFLNKGNQNHWVEFDLKEPNGNRLAVGAVMYCYVNGKKQIRLKGSENHFFSQNGQRIHFGLGRNEFLDSVQIIWNNGDMDSYHFLKGDTIYELQKGDTLNSNVIINTEPHYSIFPNPSNGILNIVGIPNNTAVEEIAIYSLDGKKQRQYNLNYKMTSFVIDDLNGLANGVYLVKLKMGNGQVLSFKMEYFQ